MESARGSEQVAECKRNIRSKSLSFAIYHLNRHSQEKGIYVGMKVCILKILLKMESLETENARRSERICIFDSSRSSMNG
jgi:hypothetical protein